MSVFDFYSEEERLSTFRSWRDEFVSGESLARYGFINAGEDIAQCVFCLIIIGNFVQGDGALEERHTFKNNCPFLRGEDVGNKPIGDPFSTARVRPPRPGVIKVYRDFISMAVVRHTPKISPQVSRTTDGECDRIIACKVCLCAEIDTVFLPCRHACACEICGRPLSHCPVCRDVVDARIAIIIS